MHVQRIMAGMPVSTISQLQNAKTQKQEISKNMTNPFEENSSKASQIVRNYFLASQMVNPAFTGFTC